MRNQVYHLVTSEAEEQGLKGYLKKIQKNLTAYAQKSGFENFTQTTNLANKGSTVHKETTLSTIHSYIDDGGMTADMIKELISDYHIDYYQNFLCSDEDYEDLDEMAKKVFIYFERYRLKENSSVQDLIKKLCQIIYQETYGLNILDEFIDDAENINETWTNSYRDIRVQFRGIKIRLENLFFDNKEVYKNTIINAISNSNQELNYENPDIMCDRLNGNRVTVVSPPINEHMTLNYRTFDDSIVSAEEIKKRGTHNDLIMEFNKLIFKGYPSFSIIGPMGAGKTNYLRVLVNEYPDYLGILTIEPAAELRLKKYYTQKDVRDNVYSRNHSPEKLMELSFRQNRDIILFGEVRSAEEAWNDLYCKTRTNKGSGDSFHARTVLELVQNKRSLLMQTGLYKNMETAEMDICQATDIVYVLDYNPITGVRFIKNISEVLYNSANQQAVERELIKYNKETEDWDIVNTISSAMAEVLKSKGTFTVEHLNQINKLLTSAKG